MLQWFATVLAQNKTDFWKSNVVTCNVCKVTAIKQKTPLTEIKTLRSVTIPDSSVSCQKLSNAVRKTTELKYSKFVHTRQTSCRAVDHDDPMTPRIWWINSQSSLKYWLSSQWRPVLAPTYSLPLRSECLFTLHKSVAQNLSDIRGYAPLQKLC